MILSSDQQNINYSDKTRTFEVENKWRYIYSCGAETVFIKA